MTTAVRFQALPPLSRDEYKALEESILEQGILIPVVMDENAVVIDGHHRRQVAEEHHLHCPVEIKRGLTDAQKRTLALTLNLDRRHLSRAQRRVLVAESIKADPQLSDREHGRRTGVSDKTVTKVRDKLEATAEIPQLDKTIGADGKERSAKKPKPNTEANCMEAVENFQKLAKQVEAEARKIVDYGTIPDNGGRCMGQVKDGMKNLQDTIWELIPLVPDENKNPT